MMKIEISSTKAVRHFGDCLSRIKYRGDTFVITRNEERIAELVPAAGSRRGTWAEIMKALEGLPHDKSYAADLEAVNASDEIPTNPWD